MRRKPQKPFEREHRKLKPRDHPKPKGVRPWREEHSEYKAKAIVAASKMTWMRTEITNLMARLRGANDDTVLREVTETYVTVKDSEKCAKQMTILEGNPLIDVGFKAEPGQRYQLIHWMRLLFPGLKVVEPDRDVPHEPPTYRGWLRNKKD